MNDIVEQISTVVPPKYAATLTMLFVVSQVVGRIFKAIVNGGGLRSILGSVWFGTNTPKDKQ